MSIDSRSIIDRAYKGQRNFMTPNILRYGNKGPYHYELSWGEGIIGGKIYGVTVVRHRR